MIATYKLNANELSIELWNSIKEAFKDKTVEIIVSETMDETEYLLSSLANKESLMKSMAQLESGEVVRFSIEELKEKYGKE